MLQNSQILQVEKQASTLHKMQDNESNKQHKLHLNKKCSCDSFKSHGCKSPVIAKVQINGQPVAGDGEQAHNNDSITSELLLANPYNMTDVEKERIKEKNHTLISQFQNSTAKQRHPYMFGSEDCGGMSFMSSGSPLRVNNEVFGQRRGSIES